MIEPSEKSPDELFSGKFSVAEALEKVRNRLLDLSMRNRLLNYEHPKARSLQFINNPDLDSIFFQSCSSES
jgi:Protein of unknown function (DUF4011)